MNYLSLSTEEKADYPICFLVPTIRKDEILKHYVTPYQLDPEQIMVLDLFFDKTVKKTKVALLKQYIQQELMPIFNDLQTKYIVCADAEYFKALTKAGQVEANLGMAMQCEFGPQLVFYVPNFKAVFYDPPKVTNKIRQGIEALKASLVGSYTAPGTGIIRFEDYPQTYDEIHAWLVKLLDMNLPLAIDIETFDLKHHKAGIGTISFSWSEHEGIAFPVDYKSIPGATEAPYGTNERNEPVRALLKEFFLLFKQKGIYHRASFDVYVLIYQLFMKDILDTEGLLHGMDVLLADWDDTILISYLATNSCAGNELGLKTLAQEHAGNWAVDEIANILLIPLDRLLQYNLVDTLSTQYVFKKNRPIMIVDEQEEIYETLFKPALLDIIQMQLTGMPVYMPRVLEVEKELQGYVNTVYDSMMHSDIVAQYNQQLQEAAWQKDYEDRRSKAKNPQNIKYKNSSDFLNVVFNPNSAPQLQQLLYEMLGLPVLEYTKTKAPSTEGDVLKDLVNHTTDHATKAFLTDLVIFKGFDKILTTFIKAMKNAALGPDGWHYLFGNFNLGGTVSGRLSSSKPNLQNLPANVTVTVNGKKIHLGKLIKSCFLAPPGWVFVGLDFASLEDRISALTTKDPNKLKVYTDGYDGHCLRAYAYFGEDMPDIDPASVASINSIETKYKTHRQDSKAPTFALTYQGTFATLMKNCGFPEEKARSIEAKYRELYKVSIDWVSAKLDEACKTGYITAAFGLRVRTPKLKQVIRGTSKTPAEAEAEGRTAGNALGQSWCLLNSRAWVEFMGKVRKSEHRLNIRPSAQIHDAGYALVREDLAALSFVNEHLVKAVEWQDHPDIAHDEVKLGGELSIFYPDWSHEIGIPNGAKEEEILAIVTKHLEAGDSK